jgi:hypothetical protein
MSKLAYVIYDARVVFTVDLERDVIKSAEVYAEPLTHIDTGLSEQATPAETERLHQHARALVEADPTAAPLVWTNER